MTITSDGLHVIGIGTFLGQNFCAVPPNQRSYAWQQDNVDDFWNDIVHAVDSADEYFIGSIVLSRVEDSSVLEVVDGQQRLATTVMIYGAIRDWFQSHGHDKPHGQLLDKYLSETDEDTTELTCRIRLNADDEEFFEQHVVHRTESGQRVNPLSLPESKKKKPKDSNANIANAAQYIRTRTHGLVAGMRTDDAVTRLKQLTKYIRERVKVISVVVDSHENAYTIFETLNDRGLDLSKADLLKNHIFRTAKSKLGAAQLKWSEMVGALQTTSTEDATVDYIRYLWISENGHVREKELYKRLKQSVTTPSQAIGVATSLAENSVNYSAILNSDHSYWNQFGEETRANLSNLIMLRIDRLHPITLAVLRHFNIRETPKAIQYLLCAAVRITVAGPPAGTLEQHIAVVAPLIKPDGILTTKALAAKMLEADVVPGDAKFRDEFAAARVSKESLARYYLRAMEHAMGGAVKPWFVTRDETNGTLEHILPQKPSTAWNFGEDEAKSLRNRIGNLALLPANVNSSVGNGDFKTIKLPAYRASPLQLTSEIATNMFSPTGKKDEWNKETIEKRQQRLADLAVAAWPSK